MHIYRGKLSSDVRRKVTEKNDCTLYYGDNMIYDIHWDSTILDFSSTPHRLTITDLRALTHFISNSKHCRLHLLSLSMSMSYYINIYIEDCKIGKKGAEGIEFLMGENLKIWKLDLRNRICIYIYIYIYI